MDHIPGGVSMVCASTTTGRSVSFRFRVRFVRVVRPVQTGEAKLRGGMTSVASIAGPPGCEHGVCAQVVSHAIFCYDGQFVQKVLVCSVSCNLFSLLFIWVLRTRYFFV